MDEYEPKLRLSHLVSTYKEFCFIALRQAIPLSTPVFWLSNSVIILQILTLIIMPCINNDLPWSSSSLKILWTVIASSCRPDLFSYYIERPMFSATCFLIIFSVYLLLRVLMLYLILKRIGSDVRSMQALKRLTDSSLLKLDSVYRYILFEIGFIPILNVIIDLPTIFIGNFSSQYLTVCFLIPYTILCIEDSLCFQAILYSKRFHKELISMPFYAAFRKCCIFVAVFGVRYIVYPKHWFIYSTLLLAVGVALVYQFIMKQPYYYIWMNGIEVCKGIILAWGSVLLYIINIGEYQQEQNVLATCVYFLPLPCIVYLAKEFMVRRHKLLLSQNEIYTLTQMFHILLHDLKHEKNKAKGDHLKETIIKYIAKFNDNIFITLWLCSYFLFKTCYNQAKILISKIEISDESWVLTSYKKYILEKYKQSAKGQAEETEAENYIKYCQMRSSTLIEDSIVCNQLNIFYTELLYRKPKSSTLSHTIELICKNLYKTQNMYKTLLHLFDRDSKLLDYYSGFLDATQNSRKAKNYLRQAHRLSKDELGPYSNDAEIHFFDSRSTVMIVSESKENLGQIIWVNNSSQLGYLEYELAQSTFKILIPEPISTNHERFLLRSTDIWAKNEMLCSVHDLYMVNREQYLIPIYIGIRMVVLNTGELGILTAVKIKPDGNICGWLTNEGRYVTSIVRYIQTTEMSKILSHFLKTDEDKLKSVDLFEIGGYKEWQPDIILCEGFSPFSRSYLYIRTQYLLIGTVAIKTIILTDSDHTKITSSQFKTSLSSLHNDLIEYSQSDLPRIRTELSSLQKFTANIKSSISLETKHIRMNFFSSLLSSNLSPKDTEKALIRLKNQAFRNLNKRMLYLGVGIVIFGGITIMIFAVIGVVHQLTAQESYHATKLISICADISVSSIHIASLAKELYLYDKGVVLNNSREGIVNMLIGETDNFIDDLKAIYDSIGENQFSERIYNSKVIYWHYNEGLLYSEHINLADYTKQISYSAANLASSLNATDELKDLIELYRNGNGQVMRMLNTTMFDLIESTGDYFEYRFSILNWVTLASVLLMLIAIALLILYPLYKIHNLRKEVWKHIFNIPKTILQSGYSKIRDRLTQIHCEESTDPIILRNNIQKKYSSHKLQFILYSLLITIFLSIITYLMIINFLDIPRIVILLKESLVSTLWIKVKSIYSYNMIYLMREQAYPMHLFTKNTFHYSADIELHKTISNSYYAHKRCKEVDTLSLRIFESLYEKSDDYSYGYSAFSLDLFNRVAVANRLLQEKRNYLEIGGVELEQDILRYIEITDNFKNTVTDEFNEQMEGMFYQYITYTSMTLGLMAIFVVFAIFPVIAMLRRQIGYESTVLVLLPKEDAQFMVQAFHSLLSI